MRKIAEDARDAIARAAIIGRMVDAVHHDQLAQVERAHPSETHDVHLGIPGVRAALAMSLDAARRAEVVMCRSGIEAVKRQNAGAAEDLQIADQRGRRDRAASGIRSSRTGGRHPAAVHAA